MAGMEGQPSPPARARRRRRTALWPPPPYHILLAGCFLVGAGLLGLLAFAQAYVGITKAPPAHDALAVRTDRVMGWQEECVPGSRRRNCRTSLQLSLASDPRPLSYAGPRPDALLRALDSQQPLTLRVGPEPSVAGFETEVWEVRQGDQLIVAYPEIAEHQMGRAQEAGFTLLFLALSVLSGAIGYSLLRPRRRGRS
jgi:hypothetical protein